MAELRAVGLNALFLDPGVSGGTETYVRELVPELLAAAPDLRWEIATTRRGAPAVRALAPPARLRVFTLPVDDDEPARRTLVEQIRLPRLARTRRWDVLHSLGSRSPLRVSAASVVTIHDVIFFAHATMGRVSTLGMRESVRWGARAADAVIAISETAGREIIAATGADPARVHVVPHGSGRAPSAAPAPDGEVRARYDLPPRGRLVLCVAAKRPHKNQRLLLEALAHLPADVVVACVGHDEGYGTTLARDAAARGLAPRFRLIERVDDTELEGLWGLAAAVALPTRAEGFGLPLLEAMGRGLPVACSDLPVLREVGAGVPHWFGPDDALGAARAILAALDDSEARERGRRQAARFSWARAAEGTLAAYRQALRAPVNGLTCTSA